MKVNYHPQPRPFARSLLRIIHMPTIQAAHAYHKRTTSLLFAQQKYSFGPNLMLSNIFLIKISLQFLSDPTSNCFLLFQQIASLTHSDLIYYRIGALLLYPPLVALSMQVTVSVSQAFHRHMLPIRDETYIRP